MNCANRCNGRLPLPMCSRSSAGRLSICERGRGVSHRKASPLRQHLYVETILRYVDSTVTMLYHLRGPSLLMRVSALATVREWKKRLEHQAHSRFKRRGGCGLPVATGAVS